MIPPAGKVLPEDPPVLRSAVELGPKIQAARDEMERIRRIPPEIGQAMRDVGIFSMAFPRSWGAEELDPMTQLRVIEALAVVEGSVGWCAMIGCDGGYITAFLDENVAREMYPDIRVATAATATATGQATPVNGGYRVNGRFPFSSGCQHSEWVWVGCNVMENGKQRISAKGIPETRTCFLKLSEVEILDTWYTTGLRGTGSHDLVVHDVLVPVERTFSFQDPNLVKRPGPLYAFPLMFIAKGAAPALGIARRTIDVVIENAARKPARRMILGETAEPAKMLRDEVFVQESVARAETLLGSARSYLFDVIGDVWSTLREKRELTAAQQAHFITAYTHTVGTCADAVQLAYKASGGSAVYQSGALDRCLRDILTMNQHLMGSLRTYEMAGRWLLGLEPLRWLF
jgi:indole-3-acetate monooxygenase